jgi:TnsA endonuclease N terminal
MAKPKRSRLKKKQNEDRLRAGHGDPDSERYKPFLLIHDFSSLGRVSRIRYEDREVHVMSDLEARVFAELLWDQRVKRIFDQVALSKLADPTRIARLKKPARLITEAIAYEMDVKHPRLGDGSIGTLTTDFLALLETGEWRAYSVKMTKDVTRDEQNEARDKRVRRTLEKLEIERRYWRERDASWYLVTEDHVSRTRRMNIELILNAPDIRDLHHQQIWVQRLSDIISCVRSCPERSLDRLANQLSQRWLTNPSQFFDLLRFLCAHRLLSFDLDRTFGGDMRAGEFELSAEFQEACETTSAFKKAA